MSIYLIEDHPLYREAFANLLRRLKPGQEVVELERIGDLPQAVKTHGQPDTVFLDLTLSDTLGHSGVREVKRAYAESQLIAIADQGGDEQETLCLEAGADGFLSKQYTTPALFAALRNILVPESDGEEMELSNSKLSKRQSQLLVALEQGLSNRDIADRLGISEHTVKVHLWRLFRRLGVKSRTQAIHTARLNGLIKG